jgi:hypothetical protein
LGCWTTGGPFCFAYCLAIVWAGAAPMTRPGYRHPPQVVKNMTDAQRKRRAEEDPKDRPEKGKGQIGQRRKASRRKLEWQHG